jgi:hypothetical protein
MTLADDMNPERIRAAILLVLEDNEPLNTSFLYRYVFPAATTLSGPKRGRFDEIIDELVREGSIAVDHDGLAARSASICTFPDRITCAGKINAVLTPFRDEHEAARLTIVAFEPKDPPYGREGGGDDCREFYRAFSGTTALGGIFADYDVALMQLLVQRTAADDAGGPRLLTEIVWRILRPNPGMPQA